ncbi:MAG TPA: hypothetical protein VF017_12810 [Thermoanaerobaculia bacterium]|nr:hypothetical protein [Thermoanaerobaculia bacterium]
MRRTRRLPPALAAWTRLSAPEPPKGTDPGELVYPGQERPTPARLPTFGGSGVRTSVDLADPDSLLDVMEGCERAL